MRSNDLAAQRIGSLDENKDTHITYGSLRETGTILIMNSVYGGIA